MKRKEVKKVLVPWLLVVLVILRLYLEVVAGKKKTFLNGFFFFNFLSLLKQHMLWFLTLFNSAWFPCFCRYFLPDLNMHWNHTDGSAFPAMFTPTFGLDMIFVLSTSITFSWHDYIFLVFLHNGKNGCLEHVLGSLRLSSSLIQLS